MAATSVLFVVGFGKGVSRAVARRFAREGFAVGAVARSETALPLLAELGEEFRVPVAFEAADAGDPAALQQALGRLAGRLGAATALLYNPAAVTRLPPSELPVERLMANIGVSVGGALVAAQAVLPAMLAAKAGTILMTGGRYGISPLPAIASLGVGKAALRNFAMVLHREVAPLGLRAGIVTIGGTVGTSESLAPDAIAEHYWRLHAGPEVLEEITIS
jgi:NAD(P)-dependent dehydrogenase (short-subunit alcohol dehydrogenase family)